MTHRETQPLYPEHTTLTKTEYRTAQRSLILPITGSTGLQEDLDMGMVQLSTEDKAKAKKKLPKTHVWTKTPREINYKHE